ncbi:MAG: DUF348 domain-containing protein [Chloroflexi bacterium]|nr:DUF348 domain-containing protein [Chloroflexota bacterium]
MVSYEKRVDDILREAGVDVRKEDRIDPPIHRRVGSELHIAVKRSVPVTVFADGGTKVFYTTAETLGQVLEEAKLSLKHMDVLFRNGVPASPQEVMLPNRKDGRSLAYQAPPADAARLSAPLPAAPSRGRDSLPPRPVVPAELMVERAVPVYVNDSGLFSAIYTTKSKLGEALQAGDVKINPGDKIYPSLDSPVEAERWVYITRSKGMTIEVDGKKLNLRTLQKLVKDVLGENGIALAPMDIIAPPIDSRVLDKMAVKITRVNEVVEAHERSIPHNSYRRADPKQEIDTPDRVAQAGSDGLLKWTERVRYENGREVKRVQEKEWVDREPKDNIVTYGTGIVIRDLQTPDGTVQYWRKIRVYATWYDARQGGKTRDDPWYGKTRLGLEAKKGVAAVDPSVIPFWTKMYVPGYGIAVVGDTGGAIKGRWIDLAFAEDEPKTWGTKWTDIYLLTPAPDLSQIRLELPDYP